MAYKIVLMPATGEKIPGLYTKTVRRRMIPCG